MACGCGLIGSLVIISGLKEEIRFNFTPTGTDGDAFHVIVAEPAWRPY